MPECREISLNIRLGRVDPGLANMAALQDVREQGASFSVVKRCLHCYVLRCALGGCSSPDTQVFSRTLHLVGDALRVLSTLHGPSTTGTEDLEALEQMTSSRIYATTPTTPLAARHATRPFLYPPTMPVSCKKLAARTGPVLQLINLVDTAPRPIDPIYRE